MDRSSFASYRIDAMILNHTSLLIALVLATGCVKQDCEALADKGDKVSSRPSLSSASHDALLQTCKDGDITAKQYDCAMGATTEDQFTACFIGK